ncbi:MAG: xanthine dehydrogenase family protein molybdopterin-binding subunit [Acidobacteria bacterium]|nr:xanthine dehydrogenase family protein molybdopterin-binding subunit [Acidobacteriota bacterium]MBK9528787.1 xanthine dehydrogenase family protein molybdopterin-binding subunit [Acidobacteriota bacterium]MBP7475122.1 xanthine dehydrogenase family protein molybdopterin-binding subunit [Pyrinomonadaceae bacterium]MBP9108991.1 xanthine dehydrogenase family protein molybdopterin-binding subunit [Pyrinomonadaceae bacterium]
MIDDDLKNQPSRVDGRAKVTGAAKYIAEHKFPGLTYGYLVQSTIARGKILDIDSTEAEKKPGVIKVISHKNAPKLSITERPIPRPFYALTSPEIWFNGQPIAVVVAETFEQARFAAGLVKVTYDQQKSETNIRNAMAQGFTAGRDQADRGNPVQAFADAEFKVEAEYHLPIEHHNAMEPHATVANWEGSKLTVYEKSQGISGSVNYLANAFGIPAADIRVLSPFSGGAFGAALRSGPQLLIATMAARETKRPVKVVYSRRQLATAHGYRPESVQNIKLGADKTGKLTAIIHEATHNTSAHENFSEGLVGVSRSLYACPNVKTVAKITRLDLQTPLWMRAPGMVSGAFALESALDELSYKLKIDPMQLRLMNYAETDPDNGKPFSSKALRECYKQASERFGWSKRNPEPRSMRDGRLLVGWGMATGTWPAGQSPASARVTLRADGTALVESGTTDIGPGTYTTMTIIAARSLGLPIEKVRFALGDNDLPPSPGQGGSTTTSSVGTAVQEACGLVVKEIVETLGKEQNSPFAGVAVNDVLVENGGITVKGRSDTRISFADALKRINKENVSVLHRSTPNAGERSKYTIASHGAQFAEVKVDEEIGTIRVTRVVQGTAAGKIINPKGAHGQEMGGVVWGIGMALTEKTDVDHRFGRIMNPNLAGYHVPVNADVGQIETIFVDEDDKIVNPLGAKGLGELGLVGIPAVIANAVYHATGKRFRELPITPDKIIL